MEIFILVIYVITVIILPLMYTRAVQVSENDTDVVILGFIATFLILT